MDATGPIFWLDPRKQFSEALQYLTFPVQPEKVTTASALRLRVEQDASRVPLGSRVLYLDSRDALEPLAEIAHCFGRISEIDLLDILRRARLEISADVADFTRQHATVLIARWDDIPQAALDENRLPDGVAAAALGLQSLDPVDLAMAQLGRRYVRRDSKMDRNDFSEGILAAEEADVVNASLTRHFGLSANEAPEHQLLRLAVLADLMRTDRGRSLIEHLLSTGVRGLAERLAERMAVDTKLFKAARGELDSITDHLDIALEQFDDASLRELRLLSRAREIVIQRFQKAATDVEPQDANILLSASSDLLKSEKSLNSYRDSLECFQEMQSTGTELDKRDDHVEWYFSRYTARWYRVDQLYRKAMPGIQGGVKTALQTEYRKWLRDVNVAFSEALQKRDSWLFSDAQRGVGKSLQGAPERSAVVVMDALRLEMAYEIVAELGKTIECDFTTAIASLPSITEVGMSALLPSSEAMRLAVAGKKLEVYVGVRQTTQKSARNEVWRAAGFRVLEPNDVPLLAPADGKVVVFHGAVDAIGEKLQSEFFQHVEQLVADLVRLFRELLQKGYDIIATADHGFLTLPPLDESGYVVVGTTEDEVKKRRYRVSVSEPLDEPVLTRTAKQLGFEGDVSVGFPPSTSILSAHGALTFLHGGISLQELVIPCFHIRKKQRPTKDWSVKFPERLLARGVRVSVTTSSSANINNLVRLGVWKDDRELCMAESKVESVGQPLTLTAYLPEEVKGGEVDLKVYIPGGLAIDQKAVSFEPQRD